MIEYILENGERKSVKPEHEEMFKKEYPTAKLAGGKENGDATTSADVTSITTALNTGTSLSNDNQLIKESTVSESEDGSSELVDIMLLKNKK